MKAEETVGKCDYCGDSVYRFQATTHKGCARLAGIKEVIDWITKHSHCGSALGASIEMATWEWDALKEQEGIK